MADESGRGAEHHADGAGIEETPLRPGWNRARPEHIPRPTYWPVTMALGITFIGWGLIGSIYLSAVGLLIFAVGLGGWIREMLDENRPH